MANLTQFHLDCHKLFDGVKLFPIEMDLAKSAFQNPYGLTDTEIQEQEHVSEGEEAGPDEDVDILNLEQGQVSSEMSLLDLKVDSEATSSSSDNQNSCGNLVDFWIINSLTKNYLFFYIYYLS